jgi:hypothetical protein
MFNQDPSIQAFHTPKRREMKTDYLKAQKDQVDAAIALARFNSRAAEGEMLPDFVQRERARLTAAVRVADEAAIRAFREHAQERDSAAIALRAKSEVTTDQTRRLADLQERAALVASSTDAGEFLRQSQEMLAAGQPERAEFLLSVAREKSPNSWDSFDTFKEVRAAMDERDPDRKAAKAIEDETSTASDAFWTNRATILAGSVGMRPDGSPGHGDPGERAVARVESRVADFMSKTAAGEPVKFAVGDNSNTDAENKDLARTSSSRMIEQDRFEAAAPVAKTEGGE